MENSSIKERVFMDHNTVKEQYNSMSFFYDVLYASYNLKDFEDEFLNKNKELLASLPKDAKILDSACGKGVQAAALKKEGFDVTATDISEEMINLTKEYAEKNNLSIPTKCLAWEELPSEFDDIFDVVFCWGNSISHSQSKEEMMRNLSSFYQVLNYGGKLVVHSRNWEKVLDKMKKYQTLPVREYDNKKYIPVYNWKLTDFDQKSSVDILFIEIKEYQNTNYNKFKLEFVPFAYLDLINRLKDTGFQVIRNNYKKDNDFYHILAEK